MTIFRYFNFDLKDLSKDKKLESFRENYLWFSKPKFFNDPFDCNMEVIKYYNNFLNSINTIAEKADDLIINGTKEFGICCFSETNNNIHMWSHYADSHKGICIEYDSSEFNDYFSQLLKCRCYLTPVDYRDRLINLDGDIEWTKHSEYTEFKRIASIIKDPKELDLLFEKLLLQKNEGIWSNERELRLIIGGLARQNNKDKELPSGYKIPIRRDMIKGVIFGVNTPDSLKVEMKKVFGTEVQYQEAKLDFEKWELKIV